MSLAGYVRARGGNDLDVAQALALQTFLRFAGAQSARPPDQPVTVPRPLFEWAHGRSHHLDAADWREIHGWQGDTD